MPQNITNKILLVDDDPQVLESTEAMLIDKDFSVISCDNAGKAIEILQENNIDVVLTDIMMPGISGIDLLERIHELDAHMPVILITAYADLNVAMDAISKGAFDLLIKPFPPNYLIHAIDKAVQLNNYLRLKENYKQYLEDTVRRRTWDLEREITERKHVEEALKNSEMQLRALASRLQEVEESERKALARELHDRIGQTLTGLNINLNIIRSQLSSESLEKVKGRIDDTLSLVEETAERVRDLMADLRPEVMDDYGLGAALRWYCERFSKRTGIETAVQGDNITARMAETVELALFRIAQETLTNVAKHANADSVSLTFERTGPLFRLTIEDNGKGFDVAALNTMKMQYGWGILTIKERAQALGGKTRIDSEPGKGTRVIIEMPV